MMTGRLTMGQGQDVGYGLADGLAQAERLYAATCRCGWMQQLRSFIDRHQETLPTLADVVGHALDRQAVDRGLEKVSVHKIIGTVQTARAAEFDSQFRPLMSHLKQRWLNVAIRCQGGRSLPPADLVLVDGRYFVVDGHHRVSVARALGLDSVNAYVTELMR